MEWDGQEEEPDGALVAEEAEGNALKDFVEAEREDNQEASNDSLWRKTLDTTIAN